MSTQTHLFLYCVLILLASLVGGWIPIWVRLTHRRMQLALSFVAGFMLGVGLLHLPMHALEYTESSPRVFGWMVVGILVMFFLERFFCFHHHDAPDSHQQGESGPNQQGHADPVHDHALTWSGAAVGLTLHSVLAGVALAASVQSEEGAVWPGLAVFLVIFFHKPFDSMSLLTLMSAGGRTGSVRHLVNGLFALAIPIGVIVFFLGVPVASGGTWGIGEALAFAAGLFVCIALSDLLPELHFHQHDRVKLSVALLAGLALAFAVSQLDSHEHEHHEEPARHSTDNHGHDH